MIIGIGPIRITAPPPALLKFVRDPIVISIMPTKIMAKAMKNNHVAMENGEATCWLAGMLIFARQSVQDQIEGSKQLLQTGRPQDRHT